MRVIEVANVQTQLMCLDLLRPTKPCSIMLLGVVLMIIVPDLKTVWIHKLSILEETVGLTKTDYIGVFLSGRLID
jgi:hypothetical protein